MKGERFNRRTGCSDITNYARYVWYSRYGLFRGLKRDDFIGDNCRDILLDESESKHISDCIRISGVSASDFKRAIRIAVR